MERDQTYSRLDPLADGPENKSNILIVSQVKLFSEGLAGPLNNSRFLSVTGYSDDADDALGKLSQLNPEIVLLDAAFRRGAALIGRLRQCSPEILVVVIALTETLDNVIAWIEAGAAGYIPNTASLAEVAPILIGIKQGEQVCRPSVAAGLIHRLQELLHSEDDARCRPPLPALTNRETQIAELIGSGFSNKEIARRLDIALSTTKSHVHNLLCKLEVQHRSQAAVRVRERQYARSGSRALFDRDPLGA